MVKGLNNVSKYLLIGALFLGIAMVWQNSPASQKDKVKFDPESLTQYIAPGETKGVTVDIVSDADLSGANIQVVPELESFISVFPDEIDIDQGDRPLSLLLELSIPSDMSFGLLEGTLKVKRGKKTVAKPLPISIYIEPDGLPPDPGEEGIVTLEGVDRDQDGVRDDIQRYIALNYPESESLRAALNQSAKTLNNLLVNAENEQLSEYNLDLYLADYFCLNYIYRNNNDWLDISSKLADRLTIEFLNTKQRSLAFIKAQGYAKPRKLSIPQIEDSRQYCNFNLEVMEN